MYRRRPGQPNAFAVGPVGSQRASNWINPPGRKSSRRLLIHTHGVMSAAEAASEMCICDAITQRPCDASQTIYADSIRLRCIVVLTYGSLINRERERARSSSVAEKQRVFSYRSGSGPWVLFNRKWPRTVIENLYSPEKKLVAIILNYST